MREWTSGWGARTRKNFVRGLAGAAALAGIQFTTEEASAQFTLDRAQISGAPDDGFMVYRPYAGEESRVYVNAAQGYAMNPLRDTHISGERIETGHIMHGQFNTYLSAGVQIEGIVGLNFHIPFTPLQIPGDEPIEIGGARGLTNEWAAMNDIRFDGRLVLWKSDDRKTRVGAHGAFTVATGSEGGFGGDDNASALIAVSGEHNFGPFFLTGHIGPHFRDDGSIGTAARGLYVGSELRYAVGLFLPMRDNRLRVGAEVWGTTGLEELAGNSTFFRGQNTTFEWLAQARFAMAEDKQSFLNVGGGTRMANGYGSADFRALVSFGRYWNFKDTEPKSPPPRVRIVDRAELHDVDTDGDGYPDEIDACPTVKEDGKPPKKSDGCPAPADTDKDGIIDVEDKCPNEPEDFDGLQDKDGCPEDDVDKDKVKDEVDKCPEEPGPPNKDAEKNGCPTLTKVTGDGMVALLQPIQFDRAKASIKPVSFPILKEVALLMESRPNTKIAIHGHTDNRGSVAYNKKLSADRAASVKAYLVKQGIDESRLSSEGFGPDKPIADNNTADGRAKNRRVEFVIEQGNDDGDDDWE